MSVFLGFLLVLSSLFLIMIVLVQRGRGGGLTGALGGAGGQSAFGAKAGDVFTRITIGAAAVWILLCVVTVKMVGGGSDPLDLGGANTPTSGELIKDFTPADKAGGTGTSQSGTSGASKSTEGGAAAKPAAPSSSDAAPAEKAAKE